MKLRFREQFWYEDFDGGWNIVVDCHDTDTDTVPEIKAIYSEGADGWYELPYHALSTVFISKIEDAVTQDWLHGSEEFEDYILNRHEQDEWGGSRRFGDE